MRNRIRRVPFNPNYDRMARPDRMVIDDDLQPSFMLESLQRLRGEQLDVQSYLDHNLGDDDEAFWQSVAERLGAEITWRRDILAAQIKNGNYPS